MKIRSHRTIAAIALLAAATAGGAPGCTPAPNDSDAPDRTAAPAANEQLAREYIRAYNDRDVAALEQVLADELEMGGEALDRSAFLGFVEAYWASFPDLRLEPSHIVGAEGYVTVRVEFTATGTGEYSGHDVDGKRVQASELILFGVRDGRIHEYWYEWDELGFWTQLGAVDGPYDEG